MNVNLVALNTITSIMVIIIYKNLKKNNKSDINIEIEIDTEPDFRLGFNDLS